MGAAFHTSSPLLILFKYLNIDWVFRQTNWNAFQKKFVIGTTRRYVPYAVIVRGACSRAQKRRKLGQDRFQRAKNTTTITKHNLNNESFAWKYHYLSIHSEMPMHFHRSDPKKLRQVQGLCACNNKLTSWACGERGYGQHAVLLRMLHSFSIFTIHKGLLNSGQPRDLCCSQRQTGHRRNRRSKGLRGSLLPLVAVAQGSPQEKHTGVHAATHESARARVTCCLCNNELYIKYIWTEYLGAYICSLGYDGSYYLIRILIDCIIRSRIVHRWCFVFRDTEIRFSFHCFTWTFTSNAVTYPQELVNLPFDDNHSHLSL